MLSQSQDSDYNRSGNQSSRFYRNSSYRSRSPSPYSRPRRDYSRVQCFNCLGYSHMKQTCWKPQKHVHYAQKVEEQEPEQKEEKEENPEQRNP